MCAPNPGAARALASLAPTRPATRQTGGTARQTNTSAQGAKKIGFEEFSHALHMLAEAMGTEAASVASAIEACGGPAVGSATTPDAVRFYDDARRTPTRANC